MTPTVRTIETPGLGDRSYVVHDTRLTLIGADHDDLAARPTTGRTFRILDVRRIDEYDDGQLDQAINIPQHELLDHLHHVPDGELWVRCASGSRASIAASVLDRAHFDVVLVNGGPDQSND